MRNCSQLPAPAFLPIQPRQGVKAAGSILCCFFCAVLTAQPAIEWQRAYGGSNPDYNNIAQQTSDGGYIIAGISISDDGDVSNNYGGRDIWVVKISDTGDLQWERTFGGSADDEMYAIRHTADNGYIEAGVTYSNDGDITSNNGSFDLWILKLSYAGDIEWQKNFGGSDGDGAYDVIQTKDGGYMIVGASYSNNGDVSGNHGNSDCLVLKTNESGELEWQKLYGGSAMERAYAVQQTGDGGYIIAGQAASNNGDVTGNHGNSDYWVVKIDSLGGLAWQKTFGGSNYDAARSIQKTNDDGFIVTGWTESNDGDVSGNHGFTFYDGWVVKLNSNGMLQWQKTLGGSSYDNISSIRQLSDDGYILAGISQSNDGDVSGNHGDVDCWLVRLDSSGIIKWQKSLGGSNADNSYSIQQTNDGGFILSNSTSSNDGDVSANNGLGDFWLVKLSPESVSTEDHISQAAALEIFPNPAQRYICLKIPASFVLGSTETDNESSLIVIITDLLGREISRQTIENGGQIDISIFASGLYLVTATTPSGKVYSNKIRKESSQK